MHHVVRALLWRGASPAPAHPDGRLSLLDAVGAHLMPGTPSSDGSIVHIALPDALEAGMARCWEAGGQVLSEPVTIPPGRFVHARDMDGNALGLFEPAAA